MAQVISRSVETVRTHRANIMEKLDLHSGDALTKFALERGIVKEEDAQNEI
ncbi:MAG: LuxR C-terminal-related transcriptional regulator [Candidatus Bipolaricaulota bacterium]